jgi:ABC-type Fe3+/spermidine/putrescine transport system ATPase subunit
MFAGDLELNGDAAAIRTEKGLLRVDPCAARQASASGKLTTVVVRPERLRVLPAAAALREPEAKTAARLPGRIREAIYLGAVRKYVVELDDGARVAARVATELDGSHLSVEDDVMVTWDVDRGIVLPGGADAADGGEPGPAGAVPKDPTEG